MSSVAPDHGLHTPELSFSLSRAEGCNPQDVTETMVQPPRLADAPADLWTGLRGQELRPPVHSHRNEPPPRPSPPVTVAPGGVWAGRSDRP